MVTFSQITEEWIILKKPQWKESSIVKYTNILNLYLLPQFSGKNVCEITRDEVTAFCNNLLSDGGALKSGLSAKTAADIISVMKNIFKYASREKNIQVADLKGISVKQQQKTMRVFSKAEQKTLTKYLCDNMNTCNLGILVCLYMGLRVGEICALKWEDISLTDQYLYVHHTMQRLQMQNDSNSKTTIIISSPKSDCSFRKIPIPNHILELLKIFQCSGDAYLLTGQEQHFIEPRTMQNRFKNVMKSCNINPTNFHSLRHTFATRCIELGFDVKSLSEILGHSSVNITMNRYVHPSMELKQKNMNLLSELFTVN